MNKSFSSYNRSNFTSREDERKNALEIAKQLREKEQKTSNKKEEIEKLKAVRDEFLKNKIKEVEKEREEEKKRIMSMTNEDIKKSVEMAKKQNQEIGHKLSTDSSSQEIMNEILDDLINEN